MTTVDPLSNASPEYEFNLSARLYRASTIMNERMGDAWLLYAPDFRGLPMLVDDSLHDILDRFRDGAVAGEVLAACANDANSSFDRTFNAICLLEEHGFLRGAPARLPYAALSGSPPVKSMSIWLHMNSNCNLACSYCFVETKSLQIMDDDVQDRVARAIAHTVRTHSLEEVNLKLAGGEPTLAAPLMERIQDKVAAELKGLDVRFITSILSNGTVLTKRLLDFLKRPMTGIGISVDGFGEAHNIHRKFRDNGQGSWRVIENNIKTLLEHNIHPHVMTTTGPETLDSLPDLLEWIFDLGLTTRVSVVRNPDCSWGGSPVQMEQYTRYCGQLEEHFDIALSRLEQSRVPIDLANSLAVCELSFDYPAISGVTCGIGRNHVVVTTRGDVASCPMTVHEGGMQMEDDLLSSCHRAFPYSPADRKRLNGEEDCLDCQWYPVCVGGCPVTNLRVNKAPFSKSPFCRFYKYFIPRYVRFLGNKLLQGRDISSAKSYPPL